MFTGIVEELGEVVTVERLGGAAAITVRGATVTHGAAHGDSIAVNGVCLTVTGISPPAFTADVMPETLARTVLGDLAPGSPVNLERPLRLDGRLGGHLVQGHADGVATVVSSSVAAGGHSAAPGAGPRTPRPATPRGPGERWDVVRIAIPDGLERYIVHKGSVAVDGVSLTVSATGGGGGEPPWFEVSLIPATLALTTLGLARPGSRVNLEVDLIGKYVERMLAAGLPTAARS
jgi:riboflavin synthase